MPSSNVVDQALVKFVESLSYICDVRNLDAIDPVSVTLQHPVTGLEYLIIGSYTEPRLPLIPLYGIWVVLDPSNIRYQTVMRLASYDLDPSTPDLWYTWQQLTSYEQIFTFPQVYDLYSGLSGPMGPAGPQGVRGETGPIGLTGPVGPIGLTGPAGPQGVIGAQGPQGETGPQGLQGVVGPQGVIGVQGPQGNTGLTGPQGIQGNKGDTGPTGVQGAKGDTGPTGITGTDGLNGVAGIRYIGAWSAVVTYNHGDVVTYNSATYIYIAGFSSSNQNPVTITSVWSLLAAQGDTGATGPQGPLAVVDYAYILSQV
jgi:hypothetical protein